MPDKVRDWMSSPVIVVDPDSSVSYALTLMRRRNIHSLVVNVGGKDQTYGIMTSTDIRDKIIAVGRNPAEVRVGEIMSAPVITGNPNWTLQVCSREMQKHHFHHIPIADENGTLIGLISTTDIFRAAEEIGWGKGQ
jgi:CBS domain-containing protein